MVGTVVLMAVHFLGTEIKQGDKVEVNGNMKQEVFRLLDNAGVKRFRVKKVNQIDQFLWLSLKLCVLYVVPTVFLICSCLC